ncbi:MAG: tyrosine-type recombinase/integrase, partial [bacterium]
MARKKKVKRERGASWEPKIRERPDRGNWMVDLGTKFAPRKLYFATEAEAVEAAAAKKAEYLDRLSGQKQVVKEKAPFNWFNLSNAQQTHLIESFMAVKGDTARMIRAIRFYEKHTSAADASRLLSDVCSEYIAAKKASGKRPRTIADAEFKLKPFRAKFGDTSISEVSRADVKEWLDATGHTPSTRDAYRVAISGLFTYAVEEGYTERNPASAKKRFTKDEALAEIHTPAQVKAMLTAANNYVPTEYVVESRLANRKVKASIKRPTANQVKIFAARSKIVPYLAIGYFAGLRPENELVNLDWKDIDFEARTIRVTPATAKKRRQRYVDLSGNLIKWLAPYIRSSGKIGYSRHLLKNVRKTADVKWSKDVMRHSFGSYLLAQNEDAPKTALQMGHTAVDVLFNHYR